jgi:predicted ATPase/class 3 adenylate cyclase
MITLKGYAVDKPLLEGRSVTVLAGSRLSDGIPVLVWTHTQFPPRFRDIAGLQQSFKTAHAIQSDEVLAPVDFLISDNRAVLVTEDCGAVPLSHWLTEQPGSEWRDRLPLMISAAGIVQNLHKRRLVHAGLSPHHLFVKGDGSVRVTGFGRSAFLPFPKSATDLSDLESVEAHYLSPEQTGRVSKVPDQRSDIYALGVIYYEVLGGRRPFVSDDLSEILHSHIAREPEPLESLSPGIPPVLGAIVRKMMSKEPRARYQSLTGLLADLNRISSGDDGGTPGFALGEQDVADQLSVPPETYGRERETEVFGKILNGYGRGTLQAVTLLGPAGSGKSALAREFRDKASKQGFRLAVHRCVPLDREMPMSSVAGALRSMVESLYALPGGIPATLKDKLSSSLAGQGKLIADLVPEIGQIIGSQPELIQASLQEEAERLRKVVTEVFRLFSSALSPAFLTIEDIQYCDQASLSYFESLLAMASPPALLWMGTARTDGRELVNGNAGWQRLASAPSLTQIVLEPLTEKSITGWVAASLHLPVDEAAKLGQALRKKSGGIPQHMVELLSRAVEEGIAWFDYPSGHWKWNPARFDVLPEPDSVAAMLVKKIDGLTDEAQRIIMMASCFGNHFAANDLSGAFGIGELEMATSINEGRLAGLLIQSEVGSEYFFATDSVYNAFYKKWSAAEAAGKHLRLGRWLLQGSSGESSFQAAYHLHLGFSQVTVGDNNLILDAFFEAGRRAKSSLSYSLAFRYLQDGKKLVTASEWAARPAQMFDLYLELLETSYLAGESQEGEKVFSECLGLARSDLDRARVYMTKVRIETHLSHLQDAFAAAVTGLSLLGIRVPAHPGRFAVLIEMIKSRWALGRRTPESILALPPLTDPEAIVAMHLYFFVLPYAYSSPELFSLIQLRMLRISLRKGINQFSFSGFNLYGTILILGFGQFRRGFEYIELSYRVAQTSGGRQGIGNALFGMGMQGIYQRPLRECIGYFESAFADLDVTGGLFYASTSTNHLTLYYFLIGENLSALAGRTDTFLKYARQSNESATVLMQSSVAAFIDALRAGTVEEAEVRLNAFAPPADWMPILAVWHLILRQAYFFLAGRFDESYRLALLIEKQQEVTSFHLMFYYYQYYRWLAALRLSVTWEPGQRRKEGKKMRKALSKLKKLSAHSPDIFRMLHHSLNAILAEWNGKLKEADEYLSLTIQGGEPGTYGPQRAIAYEARSRVRKHLGLEWHGDIREAYRLFEEWGATAVSARMKAEYPEMMNPPDELKATLAGLDFGRVTETKTSGNLSVDFDLITQTWQALSAEIELPRLLEKLITTCMKYAGAQRGLILVDRGGEKFVVAEADLDKVIVREDESVPLRHNRNLSHSIVGYVTRTGNPVVTEDAEHDPRFGQEDYIRSRQIKSVLCLPLASQGKPVGQLYFENNLTTGAFSPERMNVLGLLAGQAGISLKNAQLYADMVNLNKAFERFVPHQFLSLLGKSSIADVQLGNQVQQEMTVMFCDIRGFTSLSEKMTPQETFNFVNEYLGVMEPVIGRYHGFIDKYIGDAIMALFPRPDDAIRCCMEMQATLDIFNKGRVMPVRVGMGLNTGNLMLGTVGGKNRMDGTVLSDAVNLASRVESLTKKYGAGILITQHTVDRLPDAAVFNIRPVDMVTAEGREEQVEIYEVLR